MSREPSPAAYAWADKAFENAPDVEPKYRDLLSMFAAAIMGNVDAMEHFYRRARADGASDEELLRMSSLAGQPKSETAAKRSRANKKGKTAKRR